MKNEKEEARECCQLEKCKQRLEGWTELGLMGRCGWWAHVVKGCEVGGPQVGLLEIQKVAYSVLNAVYYVVYLI